ncbi:MAG: hypothetical protein NZ941_04290, partial [Candidatus Caldarchaeum sp.]|nr:hypothetical protein [Candidatus Caldarchaeum sp.]
HAEGAGGWEKGVGGMRGNRAAGRGKHPSLPKTVESVNQSFPEMKREVEALGGSVKSFEVSEAVVESRQTDPAVLAKGPSKLEKSVAWRWEI